MAMFQAISNSSYAQSQEQQVSKCIDYLSRIYCCIIILREVLGEALQVEIEKIYGIVVLLHTN